MVVEVDMLEVVGEVGGEGGRVVVVLVGVISTWFGDCWRKKCLVDSGRADVRCLNSQA